MKSAQAILARCSIGVRAAFSAISDLQSAGGLANDFKNEFPRQLVDYLLVEYLTGKQPQVGYLLMTLGYHPAEEKPAAGSRPAYLRRVFAFEDFSSLLNDPLVFFKNGYHWGQSDFSGEKLVGSMADMLEAWGFVVREEVLDAQTLANLNTGALQPQNTYDTSMRMVLIESQAEIRRVQCGCGPVPAPGDCRQQSPALPCSPLPPPGLRKNLTSPKTSSSAFRAAWISAEVWGSWRARAKKSSSCLASAPVRQRLPRGTWGSPCAWPTLARRWSSLVQPVRAVLK